MSDDAPLMRRQGLRLKAARELAHYRSAREAALDNRWPESTYRAHEGGTRTIGQDDAERYARRYRAKGVQVTAKDILFGQESEVLAVENRIVRVMGRVGAGAAIEPEFEQVPEDGLYPIELQFSLPSEMIGFEVYGESMLPRYDAGDVIVVWKDQRRSAESFIGEEAAVRTEDGRRYLKNILHGPRRGLYTLDSFNAKPITGVRIVWIGEIYLTLRAGQIRRLETARGKRARRP